MADRALKPSPVLLIFCICILGAVWAAGWQRVSTVGLDVLLIAVGVCFFAKPKRGNYSRALALVLIGMGGFYLPRDLLLVQSRFEFLFLSTMLSAGFVLYGIEWLRKGQMAFSLFGTVFVVVGVSCHAAGLWFFSFVQGQPR